MKKHEPPLPERKRDLMRNIFRRPPQHPPPAVSPQASASASPSPPNPAIPAPDSPAYLLTLALSRLPAPRRSVLEAHLPHYSPGDVASVLREAHAAAQKCQRQTSTEGGDLRRRAGKVLAWIERFRAVGDVVANADPIHIGLPWAGIRLVLEVAVAEKRQRDAVMRGLDVALDFACRIGVYVGFLAGLPGSEVKTLLEKEVVGLYAHVLEFLARAIEAGKMKVYQRVGRALLEGSTLDGFEERADKLGQRVEFAAQRCESELRRGEWDKVELWAEELRRGMGALDEIRRIENGLAQLHVKIDLDRLASVKGASYDSYDESQFERHLAGTRVELLDQIMTWARAADGKPIFWLCGKAGTGKSTIARTVAEQCNANGLLGASFFFKRSIADRSHAKLFFPTVARQLSVRIQGLDRLIARTLDQNPMIGEQKLRDQFEQLMLNPLQEANSRSRSSRPNLVIVLDALDECADGREVRELLIMMARLNTIASVRVFVTSRPELPVELGFRNLDGDLYHDIVLEHVQASSIARDLSLYFQHRLNQLKADDMQMHLYEPIPQDWPGASRIQELVTLAEPLFIAAFTICEFVSQSLRPQDGLDMILNQRDNSRLSGLATIYVPILGQLLRGNTKAQRDAAIVAFQECVGPLILLYESLSAQSLSVLLGTPLWRIDGVVRQLKSVFDVSPDKDVPIRVFHLSFRETLLDPQLQHSHDFWVDEAATHRGLASSCLRLLAKEAQLKRDICGIRDSCRRRTDVGAEHVARSITPEIAYACRYWVSHLYNGAVSINSNSIDASKMVDLRPVHAFLQQHLLHWLEAMTWLNRLSDAINQLATLEHMATMEASQTPQTERLRTYLQDAHRLVVRYRHVIEAAPLQLYQSALIFAPSNSPTKLTHMSCQMPCAIVAVPCLPDSWGLERAKLSGHSDCIIALAFSEDGYSVVTSSIDLTVRLWDAQTGEEIRRLHTRGVIANSVVFVSKTEVLATGKDTAVDRASSIIVWNASSGRDLQSWKGIIRSKVGACFSYDGKILATPPIDGSINIWDVRYLQTITRIETSVGMVISLAISPLGETLAISDEYSMEVYDTSSRKKFLVPVKAKKGRFELLTFSQREKLLAYTVNGSGTPLRCVWDFGTREIDRNVCFTRSGDDTAAVAFSPTKQMIAFASKRSLIDLYLVRFNALSYTVWGSPEEISTMAFSRDGGTLASGSVNGIVTLWNIPTDIRIQRDDVLTQHKTLVSMVLSPDNRLLFSQHDGVPALSDTRSGQQVLIEVDIHERRWSCDGLFYLEPKDGRLGLYDRHKTLMYSFRKSSLDGIMAFCVKDHKYLDLWSDGILEEWDISTGKTLASSPYFNPYGLSGMRISSAALSADGQKVALALPKLLIVHDRCAGVQETLESKAWKYGTIHSVSFSSDGNHIVVVCKNAAVFVWDLRLWRMIEKTRWTEPVAFSRHGSLMAIGLSDCSIGLFDGRSGSPLQQILGHGNLATALALSEDGSFVASASYDMTIRLWDKTTGEEYHRWWGVPHSVVDMVVSSDGKRVVTALHDQSIWVWEVGRSTAKIKSKERLCIPGGRNSLVALSSSGHMIASSSRDNSIRLWCALTGEQIKHYRPRSARISRLEFTDNDGALETNRGTLSLGQDPATWNGRFDSPDIQVQGECIQLHGKDELWLPLGFRSKHTEWRPGILAIAQDGGGISFYRPQRAGEDR